MKRRLLTSLSALGLVFMTGCTYRDDSGYQAISLDSGLITTSGQLCLSPEEDDVVVQPFNTFISGTMYLEEDTLDDDEVESLQDEFEYLFSYYYALTDRHHHYLLDDQLLNNISVINDSYGTGEAIEVDPFLYDVLKRSYQFTIDSGGLFNIFIGQITDLYEDEIEEAQSEEGQSSLNRALSLANNILFGEPFDDEIEALTEYIPTTAEDVEGLLEFDDEAGTITFNYFYEDGEPVEDLSITLSGMSKGMATEYICEKLEGSYPDASILINSGSSSIKVVGRRPDDRDWKITYMNPLYTEALTRTSFNSAEVSFQMPSSFAISTSGYSENYFYTLDADMNNYSRVGHIIDPLTGYSESYFDQVSVFMDDAGLADMYTTALMNTTSITQALELFDSLNTIYDVDADIVLCFKEDEDGHHDYSMSDLDQVSSFGLPIVKLNDGTTYEGDYQDITSDEIASSISSASRDFELVYLMSSDIYERADYIDDDSFVDSDNFFYANIQEIESDQTDSY